MHGEFGMGYRPLEARNGKSALAELDRTPDIAVLFSDVILPGGMLGTELAREALRRRPDLKVLFTSGYGDEAIVNQSRLDEDVKLIGKPYSREDLARRIRAILGREEDLSLADKRLLVVDDEPDFGDFVRQVAEGSGYEVTVTTGGKEFMEVYDDVDPTVVVLGHMVNGWRRAAATPRRSRWPAGEDRREDWRVNPRHPGPGGGLKLAARGPVLRDFAKGIPFRLQLLSSLPRFHPGYWCD